MLVAAQDNVKVLRFSFRCAIQSVLHQFAIRFEDVPVLICRGDVVLRSPSNADAAACFDLNAGIDQTDVFDVIVVGAGPAGLAAAVYGVDGACFGHAIASADS